MLDKYKNDNIKHIIDTLNDPLNPKYNPAISRYLDLLTPYLEKFNDTREQNFK